MFMADMNVEGCEVVRVLDTMDSNTSGGHSIVDYTDVRVPKDAVLGERKGLSLRGCASHPRG